MKKEVGFSFVWLIIAIVVIAVAVEVFIYIGKRLMGSEELETVSTNMLQIQVKAKTILEKHNIEEAPLVGTVLTEEEGKNLVHLIGETEYANWYKWDKQVLEEQGLAEIKLDEGQFYLINYSTEELEVVNSKGYETTQVVTFYKLSEIKNITQED